MDQKEGAGLEAAVADLAVSDCTQSGAAAPSGAESKEAAVALAFADKVAGDGLEIIKVRIPADLDEEQLWFREQVKRPWNGEYTEIVPSAIEDLSSNDSDEETEGDSEEGWEEEKEEEDDKKPSAEATSGDGPGQENAQKPAEETFEPGTGWILSLGLRTIEEATKPEDRIEKRSLVNYTGKTVKRGDPGSYVIQSVPSDQPDGKVSVPLTDGKWNDFLHLDFDDFSLTVKVAGMVQKGGGTAVRPIPFPNGQLLRLEVDMQKVRFAAYNPFN